MTFIRRPDTGIYEALQWTGKNDKEMREFTFSPPRWSSDRGYINVEENFFAGNWVVKNPDGRFFVLSDDEFQRTFQETPE